jgi:energy-coupling factor transporter ATP-binding protein EcfA2
MHISKLEILNYKSFSEGQSLSLQPGFNIVVGPNNSGKSALLEAAAMKFEVNPHRSPETIPAPGIPLTTSSAVEVTFSLDRSELVDSMLRSGNGSFAFPLPDLSSELARKVGAETGSPHHVQRLVDWFLAQDRYEFTLRKNATAPTLWEIPQPPSHGLFHLPGGNVQIAVCKLGPDGSLKVESINASTGPPNDLGIQLGTVFAASIYRFTAERFSLGQSPVGINLVLQDRAGNLPEVLSNLQSDPHNFEQFNAAIRYVLPDVHAITIRNIPDNRVEILVWDLDPKLGRSDLARPLNQCGTGVGQVLAILYVVTNSPRGKILLIDEPQSFLHPGAARKLIQVFREHKQNQYILATHSPSVISACRSSTVTVARKVGAKTVLTQMSLGDKRTQEICLAEVGAQLSDVFGADHILWVEGPTEAYCFPRILEKFGNTRFGDIEILPIKNTGDFQSRKAQTVIDVYNRISKGTTLIPRTVSFILDSECLSDQDMNDLYKLSGGLVKFLPRRMYENYLLDEEALAQVMNSIAGFRNEKVTPEEVAKVIGILRKGREYFCQGSDIPADDSWIRAVHGANILRDLFRAFSDPRVEFNKIEHSIELTEVIVENKPKLFSEVNELLATVLM